MIVIHRSESKSNPLAYKEKLMRDAVIHINDSSLTSDWNLNPLPGGRHPHPTAEDDDESNRPYADPGPAYRFDWTKRTGERR